MPRRGFILFVLLIFTLLTTTPTSGQVDYATATLKGTVLDPQELLVPNASITVKNPNTGFTKVVQTGPDGVYRIPALPPGTYELHVRATGFATIVATVSVSVGQVLNYDVHMKVGGTNETVEVTEEAPLVQAEQTQQANTINLRQVAELPNIGRLFTDSVFTLPGVAKSEAPRSQNPGFSGFQSSGFSIGGSNGRNNLVTIDGGENDYGSGQLRTPHFPVEAIQEFQVNRSSFAAEFGFTAGTAVNIVTKSGNNKWHGGLHAFFRNEHTDAANYFAPKDAKAFEQSFVPGFTLSGPIVKNKLFMFTSYEFVKEDTPQFRGYASSAAARITPEQTAYINVLNGIPQLAPIGAALAATLTPGNYPLTGQLLNPNTGTFNDWKKFHNLVTRLDYQPNANDTITGRFSFMEDDSSRMYILDPLNSPDDATIQYWRDYTLLGSWSHIFNPQLVNQLRVQVVPSDVADVPVAAPNTAYLRIGSLGNFGGEHYEPYWARQRRFQFEDSLTWTKGKHTLKFGASYRPISYLIRDQLWFGGEFQFYDGAISIMQILQMKNPTAAAALVAANLVPPATTNLTALQTFDLGVPVAFRQGFGNPEWHDWAHYLGTYAQDSWKVSRNFTLDFGGRLDFDAEASPVPHHTYFSPRLGFAWNVTGDSKTVVRGGGGIFVAPVPFYIGYIMNLLGDSGQYINQVAATITSSPTQVLGAWGLLTSGKQPPFQQLTSAQVEALGLHIGPGQPGRVVVELMPNYKNNYSVQTSLSVQRELGKSMALEVAYQMYHGVHMDMPLDTNVRETGVVDPFIGPIYSQIDPTLAQRETYSSIGSSIYHGMTASLSRRFSRGLQFQVNYTFSKTIDDNTDFNNDFMPFRPSRIQGERSLSAFSIKHNFVASAVYATPFKPGRSFLSSMFADVNVSPIVSLRSGIPFTIRVPGMQNGTVGQSLWARPWHAGRNTGIGPDFYGVDMRVTKSFFIRRESGVKLDFLLEGTNIFNRANFSAVNDFFPANPQFKLGDGTLLDGPYNVHGTKAIDASSPLGFKAAFDPRQVQFGLKLVF